MSDDNNIPEFEHQAAGRAVSASEPPPRVLVFPTQARTPSEDLAHGFCVGVGFCAGVLSFGGLVLALRAFYSGE